jgi:hypothetical protein
MMSRWAVLFYTPVHATAVLGWPPAAAGAILIPTNAGFAAGGLAAGALHIRRTGGWYIACLVVYALFALSLVGLTAATASPTAPAWPLLAWAAANGAAAGAALNYALHHTMHLVRHEARFVAAALLAAFRGFAGTFGSAGGGAIFARVLRRALLQGFARRQVRPRPDLVRRLLGSPRTVRTLIGVEHEVAVEAYSVAVCTLFAAAAVLAAIVFVVQAGTGWTSPEEREARDGHDEPDDDEEEG